MKPILVSALGLAAGTHAALYNQTISTKYGLVKGVPALNATEGARIPNWRDVTVFRGIPFAASTAGQNRWKPPQPAPSWNGTLDASSFGPQCPSGTSSEYVISEDCLSVNIWTPANSTNDKLPVAVWNYGAGTTSAQSVYDGAGVAAKGIVFVSYNYRTGPWGWLSLPELSAESATNTSGNYGLLDQIEVLKWVKANIASFGGDPDSVTNVGQSFGAAAVYHTVNSPLAKGLFKGAITESGIKDPYDPNIESYASFYWNQSYAYSFSETYASSLNATTVAELRALSNATLATGTGVSDFSGFSPVLDGYAIPYSYNESLLRGPANDVPILTGNNKDEDGASLSLNSDISPSEYVSDTNTTYGEYAAEFLKLYGTVNDTTTAETAINARSRDIARVSTWGYANAWSRTAKSPIWTYEWEHAPPGQDQGAYHASEINYVLDNLYATDSPWEDEDYAISKVVSSYWANFIKNGNPNTGGAYGGGNLTDWAPFSAESKTSFRLNVTYGQEPLASPKQIETILDWFQYATPDPY